MNLDDLKIYRHAKDLGDGVRYIVHHWDQLKRGTIGKQLLRSADSVAANISEGYGQYSPKDFKRYYYYSRGSLYEAEIWLKKSFKMKPGNEEMNLP